MNTVISIWNTLYLDWPCIVAIISTHYKEVACWWHSAEWAYYTPAFRNNGERICTQTPLKTPMKENVQKLWEIMQITVQWRAQWFIMFFHPFEWKITLAVSLFLVLEQIPSTLNLSNICKIHLRMRKTLMYKFTTNSFSYVVVFKPWNKSSYNK